MEGKKKGKYRPNYKEISKIDQVRQTQEYIHQYKSFNKKDNYLYFMLINSLAGETIFNMKKAMRETEEYEIYDENKYETIALDSFIADKISSNKELEDKIYRAIETECMKQVKEFLLKDLEE